MERVKYTKAEKAILNKLENMCMYEEIEISDAENNIIMNISKYRNPFPERSYRRIFIGEKIIARREHLTRMDI